MPDSSCSGHAFFATNVGRSLHSIAKVAEGVGSALLANTDPTNHNAQGRHARTMRDDCVGCGAAERKEIANHLENSTIYDADPGFLRSQVPRGRKLVRMTWVYKMKRDGTQKARICVQGCSQVKGVD